MGSIMLCSAPRRSPRDALLLAPLILASACARPTAPPPPEAAASSAAPTSAASPDALEQNPRPPAAPAPVSKAPEPPPQPPALTAAEPFIELTVEGFAPAIVSLPRGARDKRPVVLATHGNYDRPEWQCAIWRGIVGDGVFILCPRGTARPDSPSADDIRFTYASNQALEREIDAGMAALRARFPEHVDAEHPLYTGFSLGAIMGVSIAARHPGRYLRMVLVEGGHDKWTPEAAKAFATGGEARVLFVCSQPWCANDARAAAGKLTRAGAATQVVRGPSVGHRYDGPIAEAAKGALPWVLTGDARWESR